jgi:hypothetical protein
MIWKQVVPMMVSLLAPLELAMCVVSLLSLSLLAMCVVSLLPLLLPLQVLSIFL